MGLCAGPGANPYQVIADVGAPAYKCTCPSRKLPRKHALGLLLNWADGTVPEQDAPAGYATAWLESRQALASLGIPRFACTPDSFGELLAFAIDGCDIAAWAHRGDLAAR